MKKPSCVAVVICGSDSLHQHKAAEDNRFQLRLPGLAERADFRSIDVSLVAA